MTPFLYLFIGAAAIVLVLFCWAVSISADTSALCDDANRERHNEY